MIKTRGRKDLIEEGNKRVKLALDFLADEV